MTDTDTLTDYIARYSRWGRWGEDDQLGAMNLVGREQVRAAAALIRDGQIISLTLPYDQAGPQPGGLRSNPQLVTTATGTDHLAGAQEKVLSAFGPTGGFGFSDDMIVMGTQCGTQWDALSHIFYQGKMWNGYSAAEHTSHGAARNGIQHWTDRMVLRAVLVDLPVRRGLASLEPGYAITVEDLDDTLTAQGVSVQPGDALIVRTGQLGVRRGNWDDYAGGAAPGLSLHTVPWLYEHEVAAVATDTWGVEVRPNEIEAFQPWHQVALVHMGLAVGEMFDLDALSVACAADRRYEFMLAAAPLPITGAVGSPVAAVAIR
ncbi:cyclase family protein [Nocardia sp. NBC_00565]|uniref:cyclase family protein n=1 Tax=Nocardia sp. NBC_00565 TaxID=2975993 RepID=UPI002E81F992|nr:cyclase family protein [Nocardia sp. NBC_00565]WUC04033.1 cyclase family protein [Nocardia sp. NBC_00565]